MFATNPGLVPLPHNPDLWYLDGPLVWIDDEITISIPPGFITDDASVPKFLDWIPFLDRQGLSRRPGLVHDGLYSLGRYKGKDFADGILHAACLAEGMTAFQAGCYFKGVQWFGKSSWESDAGHGTYQPATPGDFVALSFYQSYMIGGGTIFPPH